ncbi:MAG: DUF5916 domain-containing protein, partial [Gemmatimonadota bacterium]
HGHAEAAGFDWYHSWKDREYSWMGSTLVSNVSGTAEAIGRTQRSSARYFQRPDRDISGDGIFDAGYDPDATGLRGYGLFTRVGKDSGGILRWEAMANVRSPGFENNDLAFLNRSDYVWFNGNVGGSFSTPTRWYRSIFTSFGGAIEHNYDGDRTRATLQAYYGMEFPNYWNLRTFWIHDANAYDDRLTRGGPVVRRNGYDFGHFQVSTDARAPAVFDIQIRGARGIGDDTRLFELGPGLALKPTSNVFVQLSPSFRYDETSAQYVTTVDDPDFTTSALRGTAVLRWEYRPGSTLFFVWTQQRSGFDSAGTFDFDQARSAIFGERPMNIFQVKATYWFGR